MAKRDNLQRKERRAKVAALYLKRLTQRQITQVLNEQGFKISQPTVSRDIADIEKQWEDEMMTSFSKVRAREASELDDMERDVVVEWEKSGVAWVEVTGPDGNPRRVKQQRPKDPRWLHARLAIKRARADLLGLNAPEVDVSMILGGITTKVERLTDDELAAVVAKGGLTVSERGRTLGASLVIPPLLGGGESKQEGANEIANN